MCGYSLSTTLPWCPAANLLRFAGGELVKKLPNMLGILLETTLSSVVEIVLFMVLLHNHGPERS